MKGEYMKQGQIFYHAKKYGRTIRRNFTWDDKCKVESDHIIYFDVMANDYRRANKPAIISEDGKETFHGYVETAKEVNWDGHVEVAKNER
jgi:hypothetical protein|tara:strand:- start:182 stop:451 length:270 start_codon:yes stop_codon:yes gene_type:complete